MKKLSLLFIAIMLLAFKTDKNERLATVEKVSGMPIFIFSRPISEYEVVGKAISFKEAVKLAMDQESSPREKTVKVIEYAHKRVDNGKILDFDGLIIELENDKVHAIKFKTDVSRNAKIDKKDDLPVYFFCEPKDDYEVVIQLEADYSVRAERGGMLFDKVRSMVKRTLKKRKNKEVDYFDAIIISPDDLSEKLIVYKTEKR